MNELRPLALKCLVASLIASAVVLGWLALWIGSEVIFLVFAGILLALSLRGLADRLPKHTRLSDTWALCAVLGGSFLLSLFGSFHP